MQTQGSLAEANLASLLQTMQSERATGTLSLENGESTCALYFLFGHLFHASGPSSQGEDVVVDALTWAEGTFKFDPRAKLPAEETIKASPADLIAEAEQRTGSPVNTTQLAAGGEGEVRATVEASTATAEAPVADEAPAPAEEAAPAQEPNPTPTYGAWDSPATPAAEEPPTYSAWSQPSTTPSPPPAEATPEAPVEKEPATTWSTAAKEAAPAREASWTAAPAASYGAPGAADLAGPSGATASGAGVAGATLDSPDGSRHGRRSSDASPLAESYPLPSGKPIYENLKSAFVDFPKLLSTLRKDTHTGYVRLSTDTFTGVLLFHDGHLLEALAKDALQLQGEPAFKDFQNRMDAGEGVLDVIDLAGDTVAALAQLLMARPLFTGLLGRFINFRNLLDYLEEEKVDGSVIVATEGDCGVILLRKGEVLGAYTQTASNLEAKTSAIDLLAEDRTARIEVKGGTGEISGIDVDRALAH